ncbi:MAG: bifunctional UDP-N-acetylglucosamine diphosphorylase/glucosamine-1-phosphate N-acetyltransferase GlmU [Capsulimonadaceae bacterium]|nr:bifunctional UDP-N-acetylglucosamine diphosphorylase/glucosamine-1-phosphate N-acetyltransferase GlmU [Capsulimonadaceae bacterium]
MPSTHRTPEFAAIVLAAGKSTRMKSKLPKPLHSIAGKPLIEHVIKALADAGASRIVTVVGYQAELLQSAIGDKSEFVLQAEQRGTGHAVQMAAPLLGDWAGPVLIVPGDAPLITSEAITSLLEGHADRAATVLTVRLDRPHGYGRVIRDAQGLVTAIVEEKDATEEQRRIDEVNVSIYAFAAPFLFESLSKVTPNNKQGEYYLTDVIAIANEQGHAVGALTWSDPDVGRGINNRVELAQASEILRSRILRKLMLDGVTIVDPSSTFIDADVRIGADTTVHPFTIITGATDIGEDCNIGPGARVENSVVGNAVRIRDSHVVSSEVGDGTTIGPFANLRPGSVTGKKVKIGDFVELKQTVLEDGVSAGHFAYLGNALVGARTNIGAGTITCNYDGKNKHKTTIGPDSFIGSNSTLVAPVAIGSGAFIAAGSTIVEDVPEDALALGRARQTTKPGWASERRNRQAAK